MGRRFKSCPRYKVKPQVREAGAGVYEIGRPEVFAVGDVRSGSVKRAASAGGEGAIAVRQVYEFLGAVGRR
jgi:thioredoxin reductase (NADPH)